MAEWERHVWNAGPDNFVTRTKELKNGLRKVTWKKDSGATGFHYRVPGNDCIGHAQDKVPPGCVPMMGGGHTWYLVVGYTKNGLKYFFDNF